MLKTNMPEKSSASDNQLSLKRTANDVGKGHLFAMVLMGYIPLVHLGSIALGCYLCFGHMASYWLPLIGLSMLYLLPPIVVRVFVLFSPMTSGTYDDESKEFLRWWFISQWQIVFNRLPMLESVIRLVPGLYATWLRLWGSKVGKFVYWSPGFRIIDRSFLRVGDRVIFGVDVILCSHIVTKTADDIAQFSIAPIEIENHALIGACSRISLGVHIAEGEQVPATRNLVPFCEFQNGKIIRTHRWMEKEEA